MVTMFTKKPQYIPNGRICNRPNSHKIYQQLCTIARPSKIYQNWDYFIWKYTIWQPLAASIKSKSEEAVLREKMATLISYKENLLSEKVENWLGRNSFLSGFYDGASAVICEPSQGCQMFLGTWYQNRIKCTKWTQNVPNGHRIFPMPIKYSKWP
jgi:hypothetical protein